jgi:hypothetical protein
MKKGDNFGGTVIALFVTLSLVVLFAVGCVEGEGTYAAPASYDTLDGIYRVHVAETLDTCDAESEFISRWDWLLVTVQERRQDGSCLVDFSLADLGWYNAEVNSLGVFEVKANAFVNSSEKMYGTISPEEIYATIELQIFNYFDGSLACETIYNVEGYKLFATLPPPDDMER